MFSINIALLFLSIFDFTYFHLLSKFKLNTNFMSTNEMINEFHGIFKSKIILISMIYVFVVVVIYVLAKTIDDALVKKKTVSLHLSKTLKLLLLTTSVAFLFSHFFYESSNSNAISNSNEMKLESYYLVEDYFEFGVASAILVFSINLSIIEIVDCGFDLLNNSTYIFSDSSKDKTEYLNSKRFSPYEHHNKNEPTQL